MVGSTLIAISQEFEGNHKSNNCINIISQFKIKFRFQNKPYSLFL
jgi:hypothetical protein